MVVDDNQTNREVVHEMLDGDYNVLDAADGREALAMADEFTPRIVLLDVMLPDMNGYEVCRRMRAQPNMKSARIIMVSAKAMPSDVQASFDAGADDYIIKPFDDVDLWTALRNESEATFS